MILFMLRLESEVNTLKIRNGFLDEMNRNLGERNRILEENINR